MNKSIFLLLVSLFLFTAVQETSAQETNSVNLKTYKVGIFAPLFLDSVFNESNYKYGKNFPKFTVQGLDFVQGAQIALDSLPMLGSNIKANFYDSKSIQLPVGSLIQNSSLDSLDLIIGSVKDQEYLQLAEFAQKKNIPFISVTYPNDGGVVANPFLVIVNSTLKAHCEAIFGYLLQNHGNEKIYIVRKSGVQEDKVAEYFKQINLQDGKALLNIQTINMNDENFSSLNLKLDSTKKNIIIGGSLSEDFALKLATECSTLNKKYKTTLIGMPNWDAFTFMSKKNVLKEYPVYYTTPYFNAKQDLQSRQIQTYYRKNYKSVPSDMTYKGYEAVYLFTRLFSRYPDDFMSHLNEFPYKVFNDYIFKPVFSKSSSAVPDYFENKRLYFMKSVNGGITKAW